VINKWIATESVLANSGWHIGSVTSSFILGLNSFLINLAGKSGGLMSGI